MPKPPPDVQRQIALQEIFTTQTKQQYRAAVPVGEALFALLAHLVDPDIAFDDWGATQDGNSHDRCSGSALLIHKKGRITYVTFTGVPTDMDPDLEPGGGEVQVSSLRVADVQSVTWNVHDVGSAVDGRLHAETISLRMRDDLEIKLPFATALTDAPSYYSSLRDAVMTETR